MRTSRLPLIIAAGCLVPLIAHVALAQGDPFAPPPPAPPAGSAAAPGAPTGTATTAPTPDSTATTAPTTSSTAPAATDAPTAPPPTDTAPVAPPPAPEPAPVPPPATAAPPAASAAPPAPPPVAPPAPVEADKAAKKKPPERTLGLEGDLGGTVRVGSLSSGYDSASRSGLLYGAGLFFAPDRHWAVGLSYAYSLGGREYFNPTGNESVGNIDRRLHTAAANLRAYPLRNDSIGLFASLMIGATWQTASASGSYVQDTFPASVAKTYQESGGPDAGIAFGAGVGMDVDLDSNLGMLTSFNFTHHQLSSDPLSGADEPPVPGIGSTNQLDFRLAFQYRFDLAGQSSPVTVTTGRR